MILVLIGFAVYFSIAAILWYWVVKRVEKYEKEYEKKFGKKYEEADWV